MPIAAIVLTTKPWPIRQKRIGTSEQLLVIGG